MTYTEEQIEKLKELKEAGANWKVIGLALGKDADAVRKYYERNRLNFGLPPMPKVSKRKISGFVALQVKDIIQNNPSAAVRDFKAELEKRNVPAEQIPSKTTVAHYLNEQGFNREKLKMKQFIRQANVEKRLDFAQEGLAQGTAYWDRVIWSDETTVRSMQQKRNITIWTHSSTTKSELPINPQIQHGGVSVMFWGCISRYGKGPLIRVDGNMKGQQYIEILQNHLLPYFDQIEADNDEDMIFMQDNAPCHKGKGVTDFFTAEGIPTLDWPPQSPDLNPIENLWAIVKARRQKKFGIPTSKAELTEQVAQIWDEIEEDMVVKLCRSIEHRLQECVQVKGKNTSY